MTKKIFNFSIFQNFIFRKIWILFFLFRKGLLAPYTFGRLSPPPPLMLWGCAHYLSQIAITNEQLKLQFVLFFRKITLFFLMDFFLTWTEKNVLFYFELCQKTKRQNIYSNIFTYVFILFFYLLIHSFTLYIVHYI